MKRILVAAVFFTEVAVGQNFKNDSLRNLLPGISLPDIVFPDLPDKRLSWKPETGLPNDKNHQAERGLPADKTATFSHVSLLGSVYILSEDKMACLVPDLKRLENMPVQGLKNSQFMDPMPNGFPRQDRIIFPKIK
jgi:hypothetical protein